jgi:hypothetical protein
VRNTGLVDVDGFGSLAIAERVVIEQNDDLETLVAFDAASDIESLIVFGNPQLNKFHGLYTQSGVMSEVVFEAVPQLSNVLLWPSLQNIDGPVIIRDTGLLDLLPFTPVTLSGGMTIQSNAQLGTLLGLGGLTGLNGALLIDDNPGLTDITALNGLGGVAGDFSVTANSVLPTQQANDLVDAIQAVNILGTVTITGNLP